VKQTQEIPRLLIDAHETARALSISERKLWGLTDKGEIPSVRIGRRVLYSVHALQGWIDGHTGNTAPVGTEGGVQ
jgi:excisionase family DNA binding protein